MLTFYDPVAGRGVCVGGGGVNGVRGEGEGVVLKRVLNHH
jgi:hypothetical protein